MRECDERDKRERKDVREKGKRIGKIRRDE